MEKLLHDLVLSPEWYFTAARGLTLILIVMTLAGYSVLLERKASAWIQGRIGPNRTIHPLIGWIPFVGTFLAKGGFIQPAADGGKFLFKEDALPGHVRKFYYVLAPIIALAPMLTVIMNTFGATPLVTKAVISAYLSFFPVVVGMVKGLRSPDGMQLDLLHTYAATGGQAFFKLRLPASMPYFFASLKVAVAAALIGTIVGELPTGAIEGLGARMLIGSQFGEPLIMWSALFAAAILAGMLIVVVGAIEQAARRRMGVPA